MKKRAINLYFDFSALYELGTNWYDKTKAWISSVPGVFGYLLVKLYAAEEVNIIGIIIYFQVCMPLTIFQTFVKFLQCERSFRVMFCLTTLPF